VDIQMTVVPRVDTKFGKFTLGYIPQIPYGSAAATAIKNAIRAQQAQPAAAPAGQPAPAPQAPGAILPTHTVRIDPTEPPCTPGSNHDWGREQVSGHGGGIISTRECRICGLEETVDTWATRPDTGEEGFRSVGYTWKEVRRS